MHWRIDRKFVIILFAEINTIGMVYIFYSNKLKLPFFSKKKKPFTFIDFKFVRHRFAKFTSVIDDIVL